MSHTTNTSAGHSTNNQPDAATLEQFRCPTCDGYIPNNDQPGAYMGALSRRDNKTEICSACGTEEALEDYFFYGAGI